MQGAYATSANKGSFDESGLTIMKWTLRILAALLVVVFLYSGYQLFMQYRKYAQIEEAHSDIIQMVVQTVPTQATDVQVEDEKNIDNAGILSEKLDQSTEQQPTETRPQVHVPIAVDFTTLFNINPDVVGWIYCEGTSINYPVLKGEDNDEYLYHQYDGTYSSGGSIFMDYRCESDFTDDYTVIYGHNMLADSMFNSLDYFRQQNYLEEHSRFFYLTPSGKNYCLEVICTNVTAYKDDLRLFELRDDERNLDLIRSKAETDTGIEADNEDHLVLLATCTYDFKNARCTLLCKAIEINP